MLKKFYRFSYVTGMILIILSMMLSLKSTDPAIAAGNPGTLWTTTVVCGLDPVDANHFAIGDNIYLHLRGFEPNSTQNWDIEGAPGGGSCDPHPPDDPVAVGTVTFDANGDACFLAYTVLPDDCGEYQVKVGTKGDNYRVDEAAPPVELGLGVAKSPDPSSVPYDGGNVTFSITITNTGNRDLTIDSVGDSVFSDLGTCPALIGTVLAPGESVSCSFTGFVSGDPGSTHTNTFTVDADWENQTVTASGIANVAIGTLPPLAGSVQKSANPVSIEPGGSVTFSVLVSNDSTEAITLNSLTDNVFGDITTTGHDGITATTCATGGTINPASSYSCSFTATVNGTVGGPDHVDTVSAGVSMTNGQSTTWQDSATVTFVEGPALSLNVTKVPSVTSLVAPGGFVTFDFTIENTSNVLVDLDSLTDTAFGDLDGNALGDCVLPATLDIGESYSCSITANITGTAGETHTNIVTGTISYGDLTAEDSATVNIPITARPVPTISVVKSANPTSMDAPGGPVNYTIDITNTSATISVRIDSISDNRFGDLLANLPENGTCPSLAGVELAPAGSTSCTFTRNLVGSGGTTHVNTVTVTVHDVDLVTNTAVGTDDETVTFIPLPTISVIKSADVPSVSELGGDVNYTITVYNEVNEELTLTSLVDDMFGDLDNQGDCSIPQTLAPLGNYTCTFPANISGEALTNHVNEVTATAEDADKNQTYDTDTETVAFTDVLPTISVVKTALETTIDEPGGYVNFMVQVTNTSGEAVTLDSLIDDQFGSLAGEGTCAVGGSINPGATYSCQFSGLVQGDAGFVHTNTVTASASDNEGNPATANDSADVTLTNAPTLIEVVKTAAPTQVTEPGGNVTFTVQV
ncbi:MAG: hypothetical protein P8Y68_11225 [Anaerolineales bacterium]